MVGVRPKDTGDQFVTFPSGEALGSNFHMRRSKRIRKSQQRYNPVFGDYREWNCDVVASVVYMIKYGYFNINVDTDETLSLLDEWDAEYCMYM